MQEETEQRANELGSQQSHDQVSFAAAPASALPTAGLEAEGGPQSEQDTGSASTLPDARPATTESSQEQAEQPASTTVPPSERPLLPPPRRTMAATPSPAPAVSAPPQKSGMLRRLGDSKWGQKATKVSDVLGAKVNDVSEKLGVERFWPTTGDGYVELKKCHRILEAFIVTGVPTTETTVEDTGKKQKKTKVIKKIPPSILANAKGIVVFSAFRSGFAPIGGSGGSGIIMIRKAGGGWSAPAFIAPNNLSGGFLIGLDAFNAIIILNSDEAVKGFKSHQFTLGAEIGVVAGPLGAGAGVDSGLTAGSRGAPIFTYVASKGFYAGVELVGQVFVEREEENEIVYGRKGIRSIDILEGRCTPVPEAEPLHQLLRDAETGAAQGPVLEKVVTQEEEKTVA